MAREPPKVPNTLGEKIRYYRLKKGWIQKKLAYEVNVTHSYISSVENDKEHPTRSFIRDVSDAFAQSERDISRGPFYSRLGPKDGLEAIPKDILEFLHHDNSYFHIRLLQEFMNSPRNPKDISNLIRHLDLTLENIFSFLSESP